MAMIPADLVKREERTATGQRLGNEAQFRVDRCKLAQNGWNRIFMISSNLFLDSKASAKCCLA